MADLPKIVIAMNINCCNACYEKLTKLLKTNGVASFDIDKDGGMVTVNGNTDPGNLVKSISNALCKKKTRLVLYEEPKKEAPEKDAPLKEAGEKLPTNGKEKAKETEEKQATNGEEKKNPSIMGLHDDHGLTVDLHSTRRNNNNHDYYGHNFGEKHNNTHNHNASFNHFGPAPPNPHYPPPRGLVRYGPAQPYFPGPTHYPMDPYGLGHQDMAHQYYPGPNNHPRNRVEPVRHDMMPPQQHGYPHPQNGYYGGREGRVSSTNNVCDYFSEENASGCAIM